MKTWCTYAVILLVCLLSGSGCGRKPAIPSAPPPPPEMGHFRVVWCQDRAGNDDVFGDGQNLRLMGYDSASGLGERVVLEDLRNYNKPLLSPSAQKIFFTERTTKPYQAYVVNWDGTDLTHLGDGQVLATWADPTTGIEWVYIQRGTSTEGGGDSNPVYRHRINDFRVSELAWNGAAISRDNFQLSADGTRAGGQFPWPRAGVADLQAGTWEKTGKGCWTSFAPDNSYMSWIFDGSHRHVSITSGDMKKGWQVQINAAPGMDGAEVYHPRWSTHARYIGLSGPYRIRSGGNNIRGGGPDVEIWIGRFAENFGAVEEWIQITHNDRADFFPDVWFENGRSTQGAPGAPASAKDVEKPGWPALRRNLRFVWENDASPNEVPGPGDQPLACSARPYRHARYGRFRDMLLAGGWFATDTPDSFIMEGAQETGQLSVEALMTPEKVSQPTNSIILSYGESADDCNFALLHTDTQLVFRVRTATKGANETFCDFDAYTFSNAGPHHIVITFKSRTFRCYVDGRRMLQVRDKAGDFSTWSPQRLLFGAASDGSSDWAGSLEGIAIYRRWHGDEVSRHSRDRYVRRLAERKGAEQFELSAKLTGTTDTPELQAILPYRRALVVYSYDVEEVITGELDSDTILVAHWAILDGEMILDGGVIGATNALMIERFEDHPELEGERLLIDTEDITSPMYVDVSF